MLIAACSLTLYSNGRVMNLIEKRDYIHSHLYLVGDKELDEMFLKVQSAVEGNTMLTNAQEQEIEYRVKRHKTGESKSFTWSEVKETARKK